MVSARLKPYLEEMEREGIQILNAESRIRTSLIGSWRRSKVLMQA